MTEPHNRRVGIDGFNLVLPRGTGVATYARTLSHCLKQTGRSVDVIYGMNISARTSPTLREVIFFDSLGQEHTRKKPGLLSRRWLQDRQAEWRGADAVEVPMSGRVEGRGFAHRMPSYDRILNVPALFQRAHTYYRRTRRFMTIRVPDAPSVMHWTYPLPIRLEGARNIYTIHDLVPLRLPHTTLDDKGVHFRMIADLTAKADAICTVSEASRREILSFHPEAANKVFNTYQSFQPSQKAMERPEEEVARELDNLFDLKKDGFFLFFGSLEPKKNIGRIIEAFLATETSRPLVLVGAMGWKNENELRFLERGIKSGRIRYLEYLPEPTLLALIRFARAVLFPSLTEGFGLPVLEGLAFGTPALCSREGALPEVGGEAAYYVDAYDTASIAAGIAALDRDDTLRASLSAAGPEQAARFSMERYAERLEHFYADVLSGRPASSTSLDVSST